MALNPAPMRLEITGDSSGLQRAVGQANAALGSMEKRAAMVDRVAGQVANAGRNLTWYVSAPIAAGAIAATKIAAD